MSVPCAATVAFLIVMTLVPLFRVFSVAPPTVPFPTQQVSPRGVFVPHVASVRRRSPSRRRWLCRSRPTARTCSAAKAGATERKVAIKAAEIIREVDNNRRSGLKSWTTVCFAGAAMWTDTVVRTLRPVRVRGKHRLLSALGVPVDRPEVVPPDLREVTGIAGLRFCTDNPRDIMFRALYLDGYYQDDVMVAVLNLVRPGSTFWDVGANYGVMSILADRFGGDGVTVHAFEPNARTAAVLARNLAANDCQRVTLHRLGLAESPGERSFFVSPDCSWAASLIADFGSRMNGAHQVTIQCDTIDRMADRIGPPDVLKIDVEGAEHLVLAGANRTLRTHAPALIVEFNRISLGDAGVSPDDYLAQLRSYGYTLWRLVKPWRGFHRWAHRVRVESAAGLPDLCNLVALQSESIGPERRLR